MRFIFLFFVFASPCILGSPIADEVKNVEVLTPLQSQPIDKNKVVIPDKLRQDGDGEDAVDGGLEVIAGPISQIITGSLSGNIGQLFNGITGTVTDQDAQPGVGVILSGVSKPLSTLWASGIAAGQKYFNITTQAPPQAVRATALPSNNPLGAQQVASAPQRLQPLPQAPAPVAPAATAGPSEDDDDEESESDTQKKL